MRLWRKSSRTEETSDDSLKHSRKWDTWLVEWRLETVVDSEELPKNFFGAVGQVLWVIRSHRAASEDPAIRKNRTFIERVVPPTGRVKLSESYLSNLLSYPQNKMLTVPWMTSFETALRLTAGTLTDFYRYLQRNRGEVAELATQNASKISGDEIDHVLDIMASTEPSVRDLHLAASAINAGAFPIGPRKFKEMARRLVEAQRISQGNDYKLAREASLLLGRSMVPVLRESIEDHPTRAYPLIEALGFFGSGDVLTLLWDHAANPRDAFNRRATLEAITNVARREKMAEDFDMGHSALRDLVLESLQDGSHTVRHQGAQLGLTLAPRDDIIKKNIQAADDLDVRRLVMEKLSQFEAKFCQSVEHAVLNNRANEVLHSANLDLRKVIGRALFSKVRTFRAESGLALSISPFAGDLAVALADHIARPEEFRPEVLRSVLLLLGRLGQQSSQAFIRNCALNTRLREDVRSAAIHAVLKTYGEGDSLTWMVSAANSSQSTMLKRTIADTAGLVGEIDVLRRMATLEAASATSRFWLNRLAPKMEVRNVTGRSV